MDQKNKDGETRKRIVKSAIILFLVELIALICLIVYLLLSNNQKGKPFTLSDAYNSLRIIKERQAEDDFSFPSSSLEVDKKLKVEENESRYLYSYRQSPFGLTINKENKEYVYSYNEDSASYFLSLDKGAKQSVDYEEIKQSKQDGYDVYSSIDNQAELENELSILEGLIKDESPISSMSLSGDFDGDVDVLLVGESLNGESSVNLKGIRITYVDYLCTYHEAYEVSEAFSSHGYYSFVMK